MGGVEREVPLSSEGAVAELSPVAKRPAWMSRDRFVREILMHQADPGVTEDLARLAGETTDDLPWR